MFAKMHPLVLTRTNMHAEPGAVDRKAKLACDATSASLSVMQALFDAQ